jgi:hypothetical protein
MSVFPASKLIAFNIKNGFIHDEHDSNAGFFDAVLLCDLLNYVNCLIEKRIGFVVVVEPLVVVVVVVVVVVAVLVVVVVVVVVVVLVVVEMKVNVFDYRLVVVIVNKVVDIVVDTHVVAAIVAGVVVVPDHCTYMNWRPHVSDLG